MPPISKLPIKFLFLLLIVSNAIFSQRNNWEITLITKANDSIHGTIYYKNKFETYHAITVKNKNHLTRLYFPREISAFTIKENEQTLYFKSLIIDTDYASADLSKLSNFPKIELTRDTIFAQLLLRGKVSVYFFVDRFTTKKHYILETEDGNLTELFQKKYYSINKFTIAYNQEYKNQLLLLLASPAVSASEVNNSVYRKKDILKLVKKYNNEKAAAASTYEYKEEKAVVKFGIVAGGNLTFLKMGGSNAYEMSPLKFTASYGFNAGMALRIIIPKTQKRWAFYSELLYSNYAIRLKKPYIIYQKANEYKCLTDASVKASYARLFLAVRYQSQKPFAPFIQFGLGNGYAFKHSTSSSFESYFYTISSTESKPWVQFRKFDQSLFLGIGLNYKKLGLEIRNEASNGFSNESNVGSTLNHTYILVSYTF